MSDHPSKRKREDRTWIEIIIVNQIHSTLYSKPYGMVQPRLVDIIQSHKVFFFVACGIDMCFFSMKMKNMKISNWFIWDGMRKFIVFFQVETKSTEY